MPNQFAKPVTELIATKYFNSGSGDAILGGQLSGVPSGVVASMGASVRPGDRVILSHEDANALSDSTVGTLYGGLYQYVKVKLLATATPSRGKLAFRDTDVLPGVYQVTPDEDTGQGANLKAGIFINTMTKGYYGWILVAGKGYAWFKTTITGTPADGCGVYAAAQGAGADVGKVDVLAGADMGGTTGLYYGIVDNMIKRFVGVALESPTNNNLCLVDLPIRFLSF